MTEVEKKLKTYENYGYKLYKVYEPGEEMDPEIPDFIGWLKEIHAAITKELKVERCDSIMEDEMDSSKAEAQVWLKKSSTNLPRYVLARIYDGYVDIDIQPIEEKMFNLVQATAKFGELKTTPIGRKYHVYKVPDIGTMHSEYVPVEDYDIEGSKVILNTDTVYLAIPRG